MKCWVQGEALIRNSVVLSGHVTAPRGHFGNLWRNLQTTKGLEGHDWKKIYFAHLDQYVVLAGICSDCLVGLCNPNCEIFQISSWTTNI